VKKESNRGEKNKKMRRRGKMNFKRDIEKSNLHEKKEQARSQGPRPTGRSEPAMNSIHLEAAKT